MGCAAFVESRFPKQGLAERTG